MKDNLVLSVWLQSSSREKNPTISTYGFIMWQREMSLVSPHCHYDPLCSRVKIIWLIAVNSLFCYCQDSTPFLPKSWDVCKAGRLGPCPFPLACCPFPLPFPSPSLSVLCFGQQNSCFIGMVLENSD